MPEGEQHMREKHSEVSVKFECDVCKKQFDRKWNLEKHYNVQHCEDNAKYECKPCGKSYTARGTLVDHVKVKHLGQGIKCSECENSFAHQYSLKLHMKREHEQIFECPHCTFVTQNRKEYKRHRRICTQWNKSNPEGMMP